MNYEEKYLTTLRQIVEHQVRMLKTNQFIVIPENKLECYAYICTDKTTVSKVAQKYQNKVSIEIHYVHEEVSTVSLDWFEENYYD